MSTETAFFSPQSILDGVKLVLADALGLDDEEITLDSRVSRDLGAESIDFLDIQFRLERSYGMKFAREELFGSSTDGMLSDELTSDVLQAIQERFKFPVDMSHVQADGSSRVMDVLTVRLLCQAIAHKLNVAWEER